MFLFDEQYARSAINEVNRRARARRPTAGDDNVVVVEVLIDLFPLPLGEG